MLQTRAFSLSASQFVHKKKHPRIYTNMQSGGLELTKCMYLVYLCCTSKCSAQASRMGARVREEVRGVTAYRPSPNRGLRLGSDARARRTRAGDSGSSACARTREKFLVLDTSCWCCIQQYGHVLKQHTKLCSNTMYHLHGTAIAPSTPDDAALPAVPISLVVASLPPFSS